MNKRKRQISFIFSDTGALRLDSAAFALGLQASLVSNALEEGLKVALV